MEIDTLLKETLSLSDFQILVYTSLLERTGTAGQLYKRLNINRATLYRVLDELVELNLIIKKQTGSRMFFEALHPDSLMELYKKQKIALEEKGHTLERVVHELIRKAKTQPTDASITIEKGVYAHYRIMKLELLSKEKIIREKFGGITDILSYQHYPEDGDYMTFMRKFIRERVARGIHIKLLESLRPPKDYQPYTVTNNNDLKISKATPEEILPNVNFKVFDDYTVLIVKGNNIEDMTVITIKNRVTADFLKSMFDFIFDRAVTLYEQKPIPTVTTKEKEIITKIGIGTAGVGGFWNAWHPYIDDTSDIDQLRHTLSKGVNYIDNCLMYGEEHATELVGRSLKNFPRQLAFLNCKLTRAGNKLVQSSKEIEEQCNKYLKLLGVDYLDQFQIHSPESLAIPEEEVIQKFGELITAGKIRYWGVSNYNKTQLQKIENIIKEPMFCNEVPYGIYVRDYERDGTLEYMRKRHILTISYFTILKGVLGLNLFLDIEHPLVKLAWKYKKSPAQIAVNWVTHHPYTIAIIKATNGTHVNENVGAIGWEMEEEDYKLLDTLS